MNVSRATTTHRRAANANKMFAKVMAEIS